MPQKRFVLLALLAFLVTQVKSQTLDQSAASNGDGWNLGNGCSSGGWAGQLGQSFTAGLTGTLDHISLKTASSGFTITAAGFNWYLYSGNGNGGTLLNSGSSTTPATASTTFSVNFSSVSVTSGSSYTFVIEWASGSTTAISTNNSNPYSGGTAFDCSNGHSFQATSYLDLEFSTYVIATAPSLDQSAASNGDGWNLGNGCSSGGWAGQLGQSFTAGLSGNLDHINLKTASSGFTITAAGFNWYLYSGNGNGGTLLSSGSSTTPATASTTFSINFSGISVTSGSSYTFVIEWASGSTTAISTNNSNPYSGGTAFDCSNGHSFQATNYLDLEFATYVSTSPTPSPTISSFTPSSGCANTTSVTINGTNFTGASNVKFGGTSAASFTIVNDTTITATPASGSTGNIRVVSGSDSVESASTFTVNPIPSITLASSATSVCYSSSAQSTSISYSATSNSPNTYSLTWNASPSNSFNSVSDSSLSSSPIGITIPAGTSAGTYTGHLTVSTSAGCVSSSNSFTLTVNALPTVTIAGTTAICKNTSNPDVTFAGATGSGPYTFTYKINGGSNQTAASTSGDSAYVSASTATAGTYTYALVSVSDNNGCSQSQSGSATVTVYALPTVNIAGTTAICKNTSNPDVTFAGATGSGPYTFTYKINGGSNQTVASTSGDSAYVSQSTATAGTYTYALVSVSDNNGCSQSQSGSATVTVYALPTVNIAGTTAICKNTSNPNVTFAGATGSGPYTFTYKINGGSNQTVASTSGDSAYVSASTATSGTYIYSLVSVSDNNGCSQSQSGSATITVYTIPTASISGTTSLCRNSSNPNIHFSGANGSQPYTFTYHINLGSDTTVTTSSGSSVNVSQSTATAGTYAYTLVSVSDNHGCSQNQSGTRTITVYELPTASISGTTPVCRTASSPNVTFTGANGTSPYTFTYHINSGSNTTTTTTSGNSKNVAAPTSTVGAYTYTLVSVSDNHSCSQTQSGSATVTVYALPAAAISGSTSVCQSTAEPWVHFTGSNAVAPYTFTYKINNGGDSVVTTITNDTISLLVPTDTNGTFSYKLVSVLESSPAACIVNFSDSTEFYVLAKPQLISDASPVVNTICEGTSTVLTCTNGGAGVGSASYATAYSNDFNTSIGSGWSFPATVPVTATPSIHSWNGQSILGNMGAQQAILSLSGLPTHDQITIDYDLYIHDTWDGNNTSSGPDYFNMLVDGDTSIHTTFSNWTFTPYNLQAYPGNYPASNANYTGAVATNLPYFCNTSVTTRSTKYHITKTISHTASSLTLLLEAVGIETACNESWSIDNIVIQRRTPAPSSNITWSTAEVASHITVSPTDTTTYTASNGTCSNSIIINVNPTPRASFSIDDSGQCIVGNMFNMTNTSTLAGPGGFTSHWTCTGSGHSASDTTDVHGLWYSTPGTKNVTLQVTSNIGSCTNSLGIKTKQLDITDTVFVTADNVNPICLGSSVVLHATQNGVLSGSGPVVYTTHYTNNFDSQSDLANWTFPSTIPVTGTPIVKTWSGRSVLGNMGAQQAILNLSGLPAHDKLKVEFDLYIHDTWDGNNVSSGPDIWNLKADGSSVMHTTFSNWWFTPYNTQAYPSDIPASNPNWTGAAETSLPTACNSAVSTLSTRYRISKIINHSASTLELLMEAVGIEVACNESWSIDSLVIYTGQTSGVITNTGVQWSGGSSSTSSVISCSPGLGTTTYTATIGNCSASHDIIVVPVPTPAFTLDNGSCSKTVTFANTNIESNVTYTWNFGDGSPTYAGNTAPNHVYTNGTYTVTLTGVLPSGCAQSVSHNITIADGPTAAFTSSTSATCTNGVKFTNTSSIGSDNATYYWDFGDGSHSTSANPTKTYASAGTYSVSLTTTTGTNCVSTVSNNVNALAGIAAGSSNFSAALTTSCGNKLVTTNTSGGSSNTYYWDFGDTSSSNEFEPTHYYVAGGSKTITLTVINEYGCTSTSTQSVSVPVNSGSHARMVVGFTISPSDTQVITTNSYEFTPTYTNLPYNSPPVYASGAPSWSFGDNTSSTNTHIYKKVYSDTGYFAVRLIQLTTNTGCYGEASKVVRVVSAPLLQAAPQSQIGRMRENFIEDFKTTGISTVSKLNSQIKLYPNPNAGNFSLGINVQGNHSLNVSIIDMLGRTVYTQQEQVSGNGTVHIQNLQIKDGTYNVIVRSGTEIIGNLPFVVIGQ